MEPEPAMVAELGYLPHPVPPQPVSKPQVEIVPRDVQNLPLPLPLNLQMVQLEES